MGLETEAWARPGQVWVQDAGCRVFSTPACPESNYGHRVEIAGPRDEALGWSVWNKHHGGSATQRAFLAFELEEDATFEGWHAVSVMRASRIALVPLAAGYRIAPVEWEAVHRLRAAVFGARDGYSQWLVSAHAAQVAAGHGRWDGVWFGHELVAMAGLFWRGGRSRYQEVGVHPDHRRRGLCSALIAAMGQRSGTKVITAERGSPAERVYRRLGFERVSTAFDRSTGHHSVSDVV